MHAEYAGKGMGRLRQIARLLAIQRTLIRHGLDDVVRATHLFRPIGWLRRLWPGRFAAEPLGVRIRIALEELGPIFVKFGQAVSTRRDLLPTEVADELAKLQDQVPPFASEAVLALLAEAFGRSADEVFRDFQRTPLAAASVAQVHAARLHDGRDVVVKVLRPGVHRSVRRDIEVLFAIAELAERYWPAARRLRPGDVVREFEATLSRELDLMREAANAAQLRRNFEGSGMLYVPEVHWDYCRANVLTMERIDGIPIGDTAALEARGVNIRRLAENGVQIFFTQVFTHNFFHADMHPGNIFVDATDPQRPRYIAVDFGIMGALSPRDQHYLAANFLAFFKRDYHRVARLHVDSGWVPPQTRVTELEAAVRSVCEPIFNKPLKDISFGLVLLRLFRTARRFDMQVQPQLVLLQKTLLNIEGMGRQLYPELDLWATAKPVLEQWMAQRTDPRTHLRALLENWPRLAEDLLLAPEAVRQVLRRAAAGADRWSASSAGTASSAAGFAANPAAGPAASPGAGSGAHSAVNSAAASAGIRKVIAGSALAVCGALWFGLEAAPAWPGWLAAGAGIVLLLRSGI